MIMRIISDFFRDNDYDEYDEDNEDNDSDDDNYHLCCSS